MRRDAQLIFATAQSVAAAAAGSTVLTDTVLIPQVKNSLTGLLTDDRPNVSGDLCWNAIVDGASFAAAVNGAVVTFELWADSDATPTTGGTVIDTFAFTENTASTHLDNSYLFSRRLPLGTYGPYLGVKVGIAAQALSTGTVSCWIGPPLQQGK